MTLSELFEGLTEDKHCTRYLCVDENGELCDEIGSTAKRWCAVGWIWKMSLKSKQRFSKLEELTKYARSLGYPSAGTANDKMGYPFIKLIKENCR